MNVGTLHTLSTPNNTHSVTCVLEWLSGSGYLGRVVVGVDPLNDICITCSEWEWLSGTGYIGPVVVGVDSLNGICITCSEWEWLSGTVYLGQAGVGVDSGGERVPSLTPDPWATPLTGHKKPMIHSGQLRRM